MTPKHPQNDLAFGYDSCMIRWEYLQLLMTTRPVKEGHSRLIVLSRDNHQAQVKAGKRLVDVLCDLGGEGWELAGVVDLSSVEESKGTHDLHLANSTLLFKRPVDTAQT